MRKIHHKGLLRDPKLAANSHSPFSESNEPRKGLRKDSLEKIVEHCAVRTFKTT